MMMYDVCVLGREIVCLGVCVREGLIRCWCVRYRKLEREVSSSWRCDEKRETRKNGFSSRLLPSSMVLLTDGPFRPKFFSKIRHPTQEKKKRQRESSKNLF